jgi:hypothetical protein
MRARGAPSGVLLIVAALPALALAQSTVLTGGIDLRAGARATPQLEPLTGLSSLFINLRHVFADEEGDRFILVGQVDVEEELRHSHLYQVYGQYKGPLGRWNLRLGRYLVPFGLHAYYDTERLLLPAHEAEALGFKLDEGLLLHGFAGGLDYALSVSRGFGRATPSARLGWQGEELRLGLSYLYGRLPSFADEESVGLDELQEGARLIDKHRAALDYEQLLGPVTLRAEPLLGTDEKTLVFGGYAEAGYLLSPDWEVTANGAFLRSARVGTRWRTGVALSYRLLPGVFVRGAYLHRDDFGVRTGLLLAQVYAEFSQALGD